jgi:two-component system phosphate regulon sensor histidine kinase PhoR
VALGRKSFVAQLTPLLRGDVLALLRDDTDAKRLEAVRRDFVANASHELRTPVTAIAGAAETLLSGALGDPAQARGFVEIVARNAERLVRLTQDLLDLSRIETGQWTLEIADVELRPVVERVLSLQSGAAARKRMAFKNDVAAGLRARGDARALEQVLVNLVDNAVKYTPEGGSVTVAASAGAGPVVLSVEDTGTGIERHHLMRLFERFYRVDAARSRELGGTGLGLAIVKHLVQAQHGEVGVESGSAGTRFWVRLPAS